MRCEAQTPPLVAQETVTCNQLRYPGAFGVETPQIHTFKYLGYRNAVSKSSSGLEVIEIGGISGTRHQLGGLNGSLGLDRGWRGNSNSSHAAPLATAQGVAARVPALAPPNTAFPCRVPRSLPGRASCVLPCTSTPVAACQLELQPDNKAIAAPELRRRHLNHTRSAIASRSAPRDEFKTPAIPSDTSRHFPKIHELRDQSLSFAVSSSRIITSHILS